ncbi:MAG: carboxypeptidase regulatory-like domain-containing protein [Candidatus Dormibacteria bacterium]
MRGWKGLGVLALAVATLGGIVAPTPALASPGIGTSRSSGAPSGDVPSAPAGLISSSPGNYVPLSPFRILDTRSGSCVQCSGLALGPGAIRKVQLTGVVGLRVGTDPIPSTAIAVVLNVTEVAGTAQSLLTIYPYGTGLPRASNLNFGPGTVIPNLVTVPLGQGGAVNIYNALGTVNVVADVEGYFEPEPSSDVTGEFHPIAPVRVCDTRGTSPTPACRAKGAVGATPLVVNVTGTGVDAIPGTGAAAAVLNLTGVAGTRPTLLSVFPTTSSGTCAYNASHPPPFSTLNLAAGEVRANRVMVELGPAVTGGADTSVCVYNAAGTINVILDANGWFGSGTAAAGTQYEAITPTRICDTRAGSGLPCAGQALGALGIDTVAVAGAGGLPAAGASSPMLAVIANLTAIAPTQPTYLTVYPANQTGHSVSDVSLSAGEVLPNLAVVQVDTTGDAHNGDVDLFNAAGRVNAVIDIEGWFQATPTSGISGSVSDTQTPAQAVVGATVSYTGTNTTSRTTTDISGSYAFSGVPPGTYTLTATANGFISPAPETVTVTAASVTTANVTLMATSAIRGSVSDTQTPTQPIVGATVAYSGTNGNTAAGTTTTDSNGGYTFSAVSPGTYTVDGTDDGFTSPTPQTVTVTTGNASIANVTLNATSGISGSVTDSETPSQPVLDATVTYMGTDGKTASRTTTTDVLGNYTFSGVSPGTYAVTVTDDGYTTPAPQTVTVDPGGLVSSSFVLASEHLRDAFLQPFTSTSIWNMPIGSDAQYEPANLIPASLLTLTSDQHIIVMTPSAPPTDLHKYTAGPIGNQGQRRDTSGALLTTVPIPADFEVLSTDQNDPLTAVAADGHTLIQGEPFARCTAGGPGTVDFLDKVNSDLGSDGLVGWDGGSHLSSLGGAIRLGELVPGGAIDHALQIDVDAPNLYFGSTTACHRWPATKCDTNAATTYTGTNQQLTMGSLLALPPTLDLNTLGLDTPGMILAKAFQDYGAYIGNDANRSVNNIVTELSPSGSVAEVYDGNGAVVNPGEFQTAWGVPFDTVGANGTDAWSRDIETIFAHLEIVTNNTSTSIGGGGTPIVPLAPPL